MPGEGLETEENPKERDSGLTFPPGFFVEPWRGAGRVVSKSSCVQLKPVGVWLL